MALYREQGVVLRTYKLGETDRIIHVLTPGRGKVRAVAKGVRKPGSRFGGRLEPFSHVDLQLYEGRSLDVVTQAELLTSFASVRADYALSACGSTMAEAADRVAQEDERSNRLFLLLLDGLRALVATGGGPDPQPAAVLDGFLFRAAAEAGYEPHLDACAACGEPGAHEVFHIAAGGLLCGACAPPGSQRLDARTLATLRAFVGGVPPPPGDAGARRAAGAVVHSYLTYHLGKPLKAWQLVER